MLTQEQKQKAKATVKRYARRYTRLHTPIVAVFVFIAGDSRDLLVAVNPVTKEAIEAEVRRRYSKARVEAWREVGNVAQGIDADLCDAFGLHDAEKLY